MSRVSSRPPVARESRPAPSNRPSGFDEIRARGEEPLLPFAVPRETVALATAFRTTWIVSSLQTLRERGHFERYDRKLTLYREEILTSVAGAWLPMKIARVHYEACDAMGLTMVEQVAMGRHVGGRAQGSILATTAKAARGAGVTPYAIFPHFHRLWMRGANGGAAAVFGLGPKEARAEFIGCELFDIEYFRHAFRGVLLGIGEMFCRTPYIHDMPSRGRGEGIFHLQWA
jgi:hypothetical protein